MRRIHKQEITSYTKLNHIHFCAVALKAKDFLNFIRHYLYLINNRRNQPRSVETLRRTVVQLTGWDPKSVTNAIAKLIKEGDFERMSEHEVRLNPEIANTFPSYEFYAEEYTGKKSEYNDLQDALIKTLKKLSKNNFAKMSKEQLEISYTLREQEAESMAALEKLEQRIEYQTGQILSQADQLQQATDKLHDQSAQLQNQTDQLLFQSAVLTSLESLMHRILAKVEVPTEVKAEVKRHLELVKPI